MLSPVWGLKIWIFLWYYFEQKVSFNLRNLDFRPEITWLVAGLFSLWNSVFRPKITWLLAGLFSLWNSVFRSEITWLMAGLCSLKLVFQVEGNPVQYLKLGFQTWNYLVVGRPVQSLKLGYQTWNYLADCKPDQSLEVFICWSTAFSPFSQYVFLLFPF